MFYGGSEGSLLDPKEASLSVYRVNKEGLEVLGLRPQLQGPGDLSLQDLVDWVHVIQVWSLGEQQLSPPGKQTLRSTS